MQEYITPQTLIVASQDEEQELATAGKGSVSRVHAWGPDSDEETDRGVLLAATDEEKRYFGSLRSWYQARACDHKPFWLFPGIGDDMSPRQVHGLYTYISEELCHRVTTLVPEDMKRALYPCLFRKPVQSARELALLVAEASELSSAWQEEAGDATPETPVALNETEPPDCIHP